MKSGRALVKREGEEEIEKSAGLLDLPAEIAALPVECACGKVAVWHYMPGEGDYCNNCVKRGCSCNYVSDDDDGWETMPCCEYSYDGPETPDRGKAE